MNPPNPSPSLPPIPEWTAGQAFRATLTISAVLAGCWLLLHYQAVLFSLFIAIVISTALSPVVESLNRRGIPRAASLAILYVGLGVGLAFSLWAYAPLVAQQLASLLGTAQAIYTQTRANLIAEAVPLWSDLAERLPSTLQASPSTGGLPGPEVLTSALDYAAQVGSALLSTVTLLLLAFFWTLERERVVRSALLLLPPTQRQEIRGLYDAAEVKVGAYVRGLAILSLSVGSLAFVSYLVLGLPNALLLGIVAGLFEVVPLIGPILGAIPAVLVALAVDPALAPWVIAINVGIQMLENSLLVPKVMDRAVGVNPIIVLLAFAAFGSLLGLAGTLLAIPLAALAQILVEHLLAKSQIQTRDTIPGRDVWSRLRLDTQELIVDLRAQAVQIDPSEPGADQTGAHEVEVVAQEFHQLLEQALPASPRVPP